MAAGVAGQPAEAAGWAWPGWPCGSPPRGASPTAAGWSPPRSRQRSAPAITADTLRGAAAAVPAGAIRLADGGGHPGRAAALAALDRGGARGAVRRGAAAGLQPPRAGRAGGAAAARRVAPGAAAPVLAGHGAPGLDLPAGATECHIRHGPARGILRRGAKRCGSTDYSQEADCSRAGRQATRQAPCQAAAAEAGGCAARGRQDAGQPAQEGCRGGPQDAGAAQAEGRAVRAWTGCRR